MQIEAQRFSNLIAMSVLPHQFSKDDFLGYLISEGILDESTSSRVRSAAEISGTSIERAVLELGLASEEDVFRALARHLSLPFVEATDVAPGLAAKLGLEQGFLERVSAIPVKTEKGVLTVATAVAGSHSVLQSIGFYLSVPVHAAIATPSAIRDTLASSASKDTAPTGAAASDVDRLRALANDGPVVKYVNDTVAKAVAARASDIHFEALETGARVRFRVDGVMSVEGSVSADRLAAVISRVKVMADLNISEKRRPQDGRITLAVRGRNVDIRVSTLPTQYGESVVMRLLDQERVELDWESLGFGTNRIDALRRILGQPNGVFLVAGPTGSGKTTTLYTALKEINKDDRKIVTVEDPIEYSLAGINQTQVDPAIGMTFAKALRAILRQDPDVVMVGEIRDEETAEIAVRAALIGRLVLSTIHTNDSISAITRLIDLGVPEFLLSSTLRGVLSQRLVRRVCDDCGGAGGDCCNNTGERGRQVVSELLPVNGDVARAIADRDSAGAVLEAARHAGFRTMREDGEKLVANDRAKRVAIERALGLELL